MTTLGEELRRGLLEQSRIEAQSLEERFIRCQYCNFKIMKVYSDSAGHISVKCPNCKKLQILNVAYFRTVKPYKNGVAL